MLTKKAMVISSDNLEECKKLLNVDRLGSGCLDRLTWLVWSSGEGARTIAWMLPHTVFRDKYTVIEHTQHYVIVELIE
jgi:hypothetical protein